MNRPLRLLSALLLAAPLAAGVRISSYQTTLVAAPDGTGRATATLSLVEAAPGLLQVPAAYADLSQARLESAPAGTQLAVEPRLFKLTLPANIPAACEVTLSFPVAQVFEPKGDPRNGAKPIPAGNQTLRHAFVNTQSAPIGTYRFEVRLPEGHRVHAIREQLPKLGKTEVGQRVRLDKVEGLQAAALTLANLAQGDDTAMAIEITPNRKSILWAVIGIALAAVYLFHFRDSVYAKKTA